MGLGLTARRLEFYKIVGSIKHKPDKKTPLNFGPNIGAVILRLRFEVCYTVTTAKKPQTPGQISQPPTWAFPEIGDPNIVP